MTSETVLPSALLATWAQARDGLLAVVGELDDTALDTAPAPGEWTPRQQLAHLHEMEGVWLSWALQVARDPGCLFGLRHQTPTPSIDTATRYSRDQLIDSLAQSRTQTLEAAAGLSDRQLGNVGVHRWFGPMTTLQCLRGIYRHDRMHTEQILEQPTTFGLAPLPEVSDTRGWFTITRRVAWSATDPSSAYQFAEVLRYAEDAEVAFLRENGALGLLYPQLPRIYVEARFAAPAHFDDEVDVDLALRRIGNSSLHYEFRVVRGPVLCAQGKLGAAFVDAAGASRPLPDAARLLLMPFLAPSGSAPSATPPA